MIETDNPEQFAAWNGAEGEHWAEHADRFESIASPCWQRFLDLDIVEPEHHVLDVGCGTGKSTRDVARLATGGTAVGVDLSAPMLAVARSRSANEGLTNLSYVQADAQVYEFESGTFDVVVSCFGAMFFSDPVAAFTNIRKSMSDDGAVALLAWRELDRNEWLTEIRGALAVGRELPVPAPDAPTPFALANPDRVRAILGASGFADVTFQAVDEGMTFGVDVDDAYGFLQTFGMVGWLTRDLDPASRAKAFDELRATVERHHVEGGVTFGSSAWLITASA